MESISPAIAPELDTDLLAADERYMHRALVLAEQGVGLVSPSPLVGCVIVDAHNEIVGEGFYVYDQVKHAEILALDQAGPRARGGTAYVTLEPHGHQSRTPPCTEALIRAGITRVVYAIDDPNPMVSGSGGTALRDAGLTVTTGVLAREASRLNAAYLHFQRRHRPFVHLKMACSLDGKIGSRPGEAQWLTGPASRARVHELRHRYDAVLIGANTARIDDPLLTDRSGRLRRRTLVRVVLDNQLRISANSNLIKTADEAPLILFTSNGSSSAPTELARPGIELIRASGNRIEPSEVLAELGQRELQSVLIEGGPTVAGAFLAAGLVDRVTFLFAPLIIGAWGVPVVSGESGLSLAAAASKLKQVTVAQHGDDTEISGYIHPPQY